MRRPARAQQEELNLIGRRPWQMNPKLGECSSPESMEARVSGFHIGDVAETLISPGRARPGSYDRSAQVQHQFHRAGEKVFCHYCFPERSPCDSQAAEGSGNVGSDHRAVDCGEERRPHVFMRVRSRDAQLNGSTVLYRVAVKRAASDCRFT